MFERLMARMERAARHRARAKASELAERIAGEAPPGVTAQAGAEGVTLSGPRLRRRFALEPALRWLVAGLMR